MIAVCMKCGASSSLDSLDDRTACPACGAIFSKVASAISADQQRQLKAQEAQLVLEARRKKTEDFRRKFEPFLRFFRFIFAKLRIVFDSIVRNIPGAIKFTAGVVALTIKLMAPFVRLVFAFYGLILMIIASMGVAALKGSTKTRKRRSKMTATEKETARWMNIERSPKQRKPPSAKRIGF